MASWTKMIPSSGLESKAGMRTIAAMLLFAPGIVGQTGVNGKPLYIENPFFANVPIQCGVDYAAQSSDGGTCTSYVPQQAFNGAAGIGWRFFPETAGGFYTGLTGPNTNFDPPSFTGLPFGQAVFMQGADSGIAQVLFGFVADTPYRLSFYLGSRDQTGVYNGRPYDGNQTVAATIDDQVIAAGVW